MAKAVHTTKSEVTKPAPAKAVAKADKKTAASDKTASIKPVLSKPALTITKPKEITEDLILECKSKLLNTKAELLNRVKDARGKLDQFERGGDEADQTMRILAEQEVMTLTDRLRQQLLEIESALGRIESGSFGYCEETEELIEVERLRAIPWTRLSIEGAEIRESVDRRYAR
ncbi:MAG: TraR/DksA family transcriptional regulator [Pseudobdellovibrio sp.]